MADLFLLSFDEEEPIRCSCLNDAKRKINSRQRNFTKASIEITPAGGGPIHSLDFDHSSSVWIAPA